MIKAELRTFLIWSFVIFSSNNAYAHEAVTGWKYPSHCCGDTDCSHAITAVRNSDGSLTVTTKHGTATFPKDFKPEPEQAPDGLIHACFTQNKLYCLYLSTGI